MSQNSPQKWFNLEEHFFKGVDQELLQKLRGSMETAETAEAIMSVTGIADEQLAAHMAELNVTVETLSAFRLAPLVAVAWADDRVEENERHAITKAAKTSGIEEDDPAMKLLEGWTSQRPGPDLLDAWCDYAKSLSTSLAEPHRESLKKEVMTQVKAVAEAAGGVLGFGSVSASEQETIARIEKSLG